MTIYSLDILPFSYSEPICCSISSSNCCFLICIQVSQEAGQVVWYSHLFQNFPQFIGIHTVKGFNVVNKAEIDIFLELSCFFDDPMDVGNLISGSSIFSKSSLNIWNFMVHILLKLGLENFEHYFASVWDECNCVVVWTSFGIASFFKGIKKKNLLLLHWDYAKAFDCVDHNKLWKILKEMGLPDHLTSWEICMQVRKQQLELDMEQQSGSK